MRGCELTKKGTYWFFVRHLLVGTVLTCSRAVHNWSLGELARCVHLHFLGHTTFPCRGDD